MIHWYEVLPNHDQHNIPTTSSMPKDPKQQSPSLTEVNCNNTNDAAIELVTMFLFFYCAVTTQL